MPTAFEDRIRKLLIDKTELRPDCGPVVIGLSGGADSVALLSVMSSLGYQCVAAHCNFQLRGEESERDMDHARSVASRLGAVFEHVRFDVSKRREQTGESIEMACRELRYEWFSDVVAKWGAQALLTGHNSDDNIETLFLNLNRGSGIRGVAGIVLSGDRRVSPLLECSRREILYYLEEKKLDYVTDSSNLTNHYQRNKWRNEVLPVVENIFPGFSKRAAVSLSYLDEDRQLLEEAVGEWRERYMPGPMLLDLKKLAASKVKKAIVFRLLRDFGFDREQTDSVAESAGKSGKHYFSPRFEMIVNRGMAEIYPRKRDISLDKLECEIIDIEQFDPVKDGSEAYFDAEIVERGCCLEVRTWREGDRIKPYGMGGRSKKVSDIFNDMKISVFLKKTTPLLVCNGEIIWIVGVRASESHKVSGDSRRVAVFRKKS